MSYVLPVIGTERNQSTMHTYLILLSPGHNRVYFQSAQALALAELQCVAQRMQQPLLSQDAVEIAGIAYIRFKTEQPLQAADLQKLSRLSFCYALFEAVSDGLLRPVERVTGYAMDEGLSRILKYTGKTNELFTRMMLNVAHACSDFADGSGIALLDPVAGKGTTLYEALIAGYDAAGIEIGTKVVAEAMGYFKKYLETEHYKHTQHKERLSGANKSFTSEIYRFEFAKAKGDPSQTLTMVAGNSLHADQYFRKQSFHLLVGDLPYGVQHGNVTNEKQSGLTRNSLGLLDTCLPVWYEVLKVGGAMVLAYNRQITKKDEMQKIVTKHGFTLCEPSGEDAFAHRVDQSIYRDLIIARKERPI